MDHQKIESQFQEKLREIYEQHGSLQDRISADEFVGMFTVKYKDGRPLQPVAPEDVDNTTFQKVMAAFNDVYP